MSRAGLDQSQPDQRHVPSAVADRLRLHRQQCGHPPAGRDKAPSRTRRPDGYKPSAKGGNNPENSSQAERRRHSCGIRAPTSGRGGSTTPTSCCRGDTSPGWPHPQQCGRTARTVRCGASKLWTIRAFCPIVRITEHTSRRTRQKPGAAHHDCNYRRRRPALSVVGVFSCTPVCTPI